MTMFNPDLTLDVAGLSKLCLGTMTFGRQNTLEQAHDQLNWAYGQGLRFWDTAEMYPVPAQEATYGDTERIIGAWIEKYGQRQQLFLATKVAGPNRSMGYIRPNLGYSPEALDHALQQSLERLRTDYIDLYQLHWPERHSPMFGQRGFSGYDDAWEDNMLEVLRHIDGWVKAGKIRYFGLSNETPWGLMRFHTLAQQAGLTPISSVQNPYSLLNRTPEMGLSEVCWREKISFLAYSPLAFGLLSGKYEDGLTHPEARLHAFPQMARYNHPNTRQAATAYVELAREAGLRPAQMALAFVMQQPFVSAAIIGATTLEQLRENMDAAQIRLSDDVLQRIQQIHQTWPDPAP